MNLSLNSCHFFTLAVILLVFSDRVFCADEKRRAIADTRKNQLGKKGGSFVSDVMNEGSGGGGGGGMSTDIDWDGSGHGPDDEDADDDLDGQASGHRVSDTESHRSRPVDQKHPSKNNNDDDEDEDDGESSGDITDDNPETTTSTTQEPTTTTTRRRPEPTTEAEEIFEVTDEPVTDATSRAPSPTIPKAQPTQPPTTIYDTGNRQTFDIFQRQGILAAVIGGAVVGLLAAILLVMFIVYRMRKKDEGSYALDEPKQPPHYSYAYQKAPTKEFYA